ncbi:molybdopterin molybdotransferase MoeA [Sphingomonas japonica]|uniref:Molybdopterin molybdenumtransferase n=1 Tax=Sphingomonas japonica TaxID=511662 RepID=A0ABX0U740_9SPHN|nr:molybdopterin molybdotransferase MoeA [Sphingomonas japonica]NIJ24588.1 molybdopterin molybdotransferase [Sphingomonas japonica]
MSLLPVAEAQARLLALLPLLATEPVALRDAAGRWAAEPLAALRTQPASDLSAMDGYAIRHADLPGPWRVVGESAAGHRFDGAITAGDAVRIFTGAAMPSGADCVLVQEEARRDGAVLTLAGDGPRGPGGNVRRRGLDFSCGDPLVAVGEQLTPQLLGLAAVAGHAQVEVRRRVCVAVAATGDELVAPGSDLGPDQLPESNGVMLSAMLAALPVDIVDLGILPDRLEVMVEAFAGIDADMLVTTGGASVGDHDLICPALTAAGAEIDFWRIALRPGKPMLAGRMRDTVVLGLPGNPVSAFVTAHLFVLPMVRALGGAAMPWPTPVPAVAGSALPANGDRLDYMRATLADGVATPADAQDSSMLRTLARAQCLIVRQPHAPPMAKGERVDILPIA